MKHIVVSRTKAVAIGLVSAWVCAADPLVATALPKASAWKGTLPWSAPAWTPNANVLPSPVTPARALLHQARSASAKAANTSAWKVDVRAEFSPTGHLLRLAGRHLRWLPTGAALPTPPVPATWAVAALAKAYAALGLSPSEDSLAPQGLTPLVPGKAWVVRLSRFHLKVPVLGDEVRLEVWADGSVRGLDVHLAQFQASGDGSEALLQSLASGEVTALDGASPVPEAVKVVSNAGAMRVMRWSDGATIRETSPEAMGFRAVVTSRLKAPTPADHLCSDIPASKCADTGTSAWVVEDLWAPHCCKEAGVNQPNCQLGAPGACLDETSPAVLAGRDAVAQMGSKLSALGIDGYEENPSGGVQPDLVVSPHVGVIDSEACRFGASVCKNTVGFECKGDVGADECAIAFRPGGSNSVTCEPGLGATKGAILMSDAANQQPDVLAHEFAHLWQVGHALPYPDCNEVACQPLTLHESVADGFGLLVDDDDWLLGEATVCNGYRSACAPECKSDAEIASYTLDPGCWQGPHPQPGAGNPTCSQEQPRLWANYALKPGAGVYFDGHFNSGLSNFLWFLIGSTQNHQLGGGPAVQSGVVAGAGRPALGALLGRWPLGFNAFDKPTFDGLREVLIQTAAAVDPQLLETVERAVDAVGLWRTDTPGSSLWGVGRVASFVHSDGQGSTLAYAVNWDGVRRFNATRCLVGPGACDGQSIRIESLSWPDAMYPASPPVAVDTGPDETHLLFVSFSGELYAQRVLQGAFDAPFNTGAVAPGTLPAGMALGAIADRSGGPGLNPASTVIAYACAAPDCTCGGQLQAGQRAICAQGLDGAWFKVVDLLADIPVVCSGLLQPLQSPSVIDRVAPLHEPALTALGGSLVVTWVDEAATDNLFRIHYRVAKPQGQGWQWGPVKPWVSKGEVAATDLRARTARPHSAAVLPGAAGWSMLPEDNEDLVQIMFTPFTYPDPVCLDAPRMFAFASARLAADGLDLVGFSMAAPQNAGKTQLLVTEGPYAVDSLADHAGAGSFLAAGQRTYAWVRLPTAPCPLTVPPSLVCANNAPDYAIAPVPSYGQVLVKSTGWR